MVRYSTRGHTGGVRSAVHRPWCDKSPVVFATTGLCYTWDTIHATIAASKRLTQQNLVILLRSPDPNKSPHAAERERQQKIGFVAFRARGVVAALLKKGTIFPPSVQDGKIVPHHSCIRQPNIMRPRVRPYATRLFFCPHRVFCFQLRRSHRVNHRNGRAAMVHRLADALDIAIPPQQLHGIHLPKAVRGHILWQPERLCGPFHILPHRLTCPVLPEVPSGENPISPTGFRTQFRNQPVRQVHPTPFPRLLLHNPELSPDLPRAQHQNVADPQARV